MHAVLAYVIGRNFLADIRVSVSGLNLAIIVGEGAKSIMQCVFLLLYYQGKSAIEGKTAVQKRISRFSPGKIG